MFKSIDHIAIATDDIDGALSVYRDVFGLSVTHRAVYTELGVEVAALRIGESCVEFVRPLDKDSKVAKFLQERGQGIHHVAFQVEDIHESIEALKAKGLQVIRDGVKQGVEGKLIAFLHPKDCHNVLVELVQKG